MSELIQEITLDISKESEYCKIEIPQGDFIDRIFYIKLINGSSDYVIPSTAFVSFNMSRIGAEPIFNNCPVTPDGKIKFTITPAISAISGRHPFTFTIDDSTSGGSTSSFVSTMLVKKGVDIENFLVTTGEYTQLRNMMHQVGDVVNQVIACKEATEDAIEATNNANTATTNANNAATLANEKAALADTAATDAINATNDLEDLNTTVTNAESARATAETNRINDELIRQNNEDERQEFFDAYKVCEVYNNAKQYVVGNKVTYAGSTYQCLVNSIGSAPPTLGNSTWLLIAEKGMDGTGGDMVRSVYDPTNKQTDFFAYADDKIGNLDDLNTSSNTDLVGAVNEVSSQLGETIGSGVLSGLQVSAQTTPNMTVLVQTGVIYLSDGKRYTPIANNSLAINPSDTANNRIDIVYINSSGVISYLAGELSTKGARTYTVTSNFTSGNTLTLCGITLTATSSTTDATNFAVGATIADTVANIKSSLVLNYLATTYLPTSSGATFTLTEKYSGGGNTPTVATYTGTGVVSSGTAITSVPAEQPVTPIGGELLANIKVLANSTSITSTSIVDKRKIIYNNNQLMNNWLYGKTINFISDSIGVVGYPNYPTVVGQMLWCKVNNYGISGDKLTGVSGINARVLNMDTSASVNVILGGTNDYTWNTPLGNITDTVNTTIYGALNIMCNNLVATYPNAINVLMTPLKRSRASDIPTTYPLESVANAICEIAKKYNMMVIDLHNEAPNFNPNIAGLKDRWETDGLHPNTAYITTFLANKIAKNLLLLNSSSTKPNIQTFAFTPDASFSSITYELKKDINKVVTFSLSSGVVNIPIGTTLIGVVCNECFPSRITLGSASAGDPLTPVTIWIDGSGNVRVTSATAFANTTLYGTVTYRAKN